MRMVKSEIYFPIIVGVHLVIWAVDLAIFDGPIAQNPGESATQRVLGEVLSSWVITVFGFNLLMATRARWVERVFGGLDKMYLIHRRAGIIAVVLLLLHFGIVPRDPVFTLGKPMGFAAMILIFSGVVLSGAPIFRRKIPYHKWVGVHRLMGPFFVVGVCHALFVPTLISQLPLTRIYVFGMAAMGVSSWLYRVFLHRLVHPALPYEVGSVKRWGKAVVELSLKPVEQALEHRAGQFAFFSFPSISRSESHPFTIASEPGASTLRVVVKASGDFTSQLVEGIVEGVPVLVEGPYGHLTQDRVGEQNQVWIAGGIGVTPFLSLARDLTPKGKQVTLYWSVRSAEEAFFDEELRSLAATHSAFSYTLWPSNENGFLAAEDIAEISAWEDPDFLICGPMALRDSFTAQVNEGGVKPSKVYYEEFAFR